MKYQCLFALFILGLQSCSLHDDSHAGNVDGAGQNRLLQYMEAVEYPADSINAVVDIEGNPCTLRNLCSRKGRFFLYIDRRHCVSCWKKDIEVVSTLTDKPDCVSAMAVVASGFSSRELKIMRRETGLDIYSVGADSAIPHALTKFFLPFFFVLTPDGNLVLPYYPSREDDEKFLRNYLSLVEARLNKAVSFEPVWNGTAGRQLAIVNENLDLGEVHVRRKACGTFELRNQGKTDCEIRQIYPSCSCILIDEYTKVIKAGETGRVCFTTVQQYKGKFHHSIQFQTDSEREPYTLVFHGECK